MPDDSRRLVIQTREGKFPYLKSANNPTGVSSMSELHRHVIVRTRDAGCFAGMLISQDRDMATLENARRIWFWEGAASLSQLAMEGTSKPELCKFPIAVSRIVLTGVIETIDTTPKARASIDSVPVWSA